MKQNSLILNKEKNRSRGHLIECITDADYLDDLALLANVPTQAESLLHSLNQTVRSTDLCINLNKFVCLIRMSPSPH